MSLDRIRLLVTRFRERVAGAKPDRAVSGNLGRELARELLESMLLARYLDLQAHELRASGHGHYTICSSGHEANVVLGRLTRKTDPSLLHYRSAALQIERARGLSGLDPVRDIALSLVASSEEPTSGGRHKLFGHPSLGILPKTSTIASHLPRATGLAFALEQRARLGLSGSEPRDSIVLVSFGDASVNHSTAQGAFNATSFLAYQHLPLPILFVCEDNGLGISVRTPAGWIRERLSTLPQVRFFEADGSRILETYAAAEAATSYVRSARRPAVLHLTCERLLGHAGSDVDSSYRTAKEIELALSRDPVLCAALDFIGAGSLSANEILELDHSAAERVASEARRAISRPKLESRAQIMEKIAPDVSDATRAGSESTATAPAHERWTLAQGINAALVEILDEHPEALVFGEDVAKKGGVYGVTKGLFERFGPLRVYNTLLDEQTILGFALGAGTLGMLPIPEIQYLAYLHNAEDQLRGEAATMSFFSAGATHNPLLLRIAGLGYQKGFGGHFHNDNSLAVLRDIPGVVLVVPARADDALPLWRSARALAVESGRVVVFVEPIALYHRRDLYADGDGEWLAAPNAGSAAFARARVYHPQATDLVIFTYGNGVYLSLRAARSLEREHGIFARVVDLRWLVPLPIDDVLTHASQTRRVLVVDECRRSGNISEALGTALLDANVSARFARVTSADSFIPLGDAAELILLSEAEIVAAARALVQRA